MALFFILVGPFQRQSPMVFRCAWLVMTSCSHKGVYAAEIMQTEMLWCWLLFSIWSYDEISAFKKACTGVAIQLLRADLDSLPGFGLRHLGHNDGQDPVLHASLDVFVVDGVGEGETAGKFADTAL